MCGSAARFGLVASLAAATISAIEFDPFFYTNEWEDICATGQHQSPIIIDSAAAQANPVPEDLVTDMIFPTVSGLQLVNVGNGLKFEWKDIDLDALPIVRAGGDGISAVLMDPSIPVDREVKVQPIQAHMHSPAEHVIDGYYTAAEGHVVTLVAKGEAPDWGCDAFWDGGDPVFERCAAVFGTIFKLSEDPTHEPAYIGPNYATGPEVVDDTAKFPAVTEDGDLNDWVPAEDRSYFTYLGSLTTPTCNEGLRWHVFKQPLTITPATMELMENYVAFSTNEAGNAILGYRSDSRFVQPMNDRPIWYHQDPSAPAPRVPAGCMMEEPGMYGDMGMSGDMA